MTLRATCFFALAGIGTAGAASATEWPSTQVTVSPSLSNSTLGVTSNNAVVDPEGRVHLVYQENVGGNRSEVLYVAREPNGTWGVSPIHLSPPGTNARNASIARDPEGRLHVLWEDATQEDEEVGHVMRQADGTWMEPEFVAPAPGSSLFPVGAVDSFGRLHVVWIDTRNSVQRVLHAVWSDNSGWTGPQALSIGGISPQDVTIDADQLGGVHILWSDRVPSDPNNPVWSIFYVRLDVAAAAIPPPVVLVQGQGLALRPFLEAKDDGTLHLVWLDDRAASRLASFEIFYKRFLPGIGWGRIKRFTYDITNHGRPVIVAGAGESLNLVWEDYRGGPPDILYRQITPEKGWEREATPLTTDITSSQDPTLVSLPNGNLLLIWSDSQETGTFRILAKEGSAVSGS
jgi:hypothetical protein